MKKYAILNPLDGLYVYVDNITDCSSKLSEYAWNLFLAQTHNSPYSTITINDDLTETWASPEGNIQRSPEELQKFIEEFIKASDEKANG